MFKNCLILLSFFLLAIISCDSSPSLKQPSSKHDASDLSSKFSIDVIDMLLDKSHKMAGGPDLYGSEVVLLDNEEGYNDTPMGAYLDNWMPNMSAREQIDKVVPIILDNLIESLTCKASCTEGFLEDVKNNQSEIEEELKTLSTRIVQNEIKNRENFIVYYHAYPNEFRLYQDVLRVIKSFEFLSRLSNTYPFRDFDFVESKIQVNDFLKPWWEEFEKFAKEEGKSVYPEEGKREQARFIGLSMFPDSIPYAQKHLLSANMNFLGNNTSLKNSSVFFFLNSTSATKSNIADILMELSLGPYVIKEGGEKDEGRLKDIVRQLKTVFEKDMAHTGGQLAQIFIAKNVAPEVSFPCWNGGEPLWLLKETGKVALATRASGRSSFAPPLIFWTDNSEYMPFNIVDFMNLFIKKPQEFQRVFPVKKIAMRAEVAKWLDAEPNSPRVGIFFSQDYAQSRILPNPKYFTDQNLTGVEIFTRYPINREAQKLYEQEIYDIIRDVFADFLAVASKDDFKEGNFKLKSVFKERAHDAQQ